MTKYHDKCGAVTERYPDNECRPCSMARKRNRRENGPAPRIIRVGNVEITVRRT